MDLKPLSLTEYLRSFGASDNEGEWEGVNTDERQFLGGFTPEGRKREKLRELQGGLKAAYQDYVQKFNTQHVKASIERSIAPPSYAEAGRRVPGMERLAPMQETTQQASQLLPFNEKGYQDAALLPGTFDVNDLGHSGLEGFAQSPDGAMPRTPIRYPAQIPDQPIPFQQSNPQARLMPADVALYNQLAGQPSAIDPETGALTPMQLAKPQTQILQPDQSNALLQAAGYDPPQPINVPLPATSINALMQAQKPSKSDMGDYAESLASVESRKKYGKALSFRELADRDPALAERVRQQSLVNERKEMYEFQQNELGKRQLALAGPLAEEQARSREAVQADVRLSGPTMIMSKLTNLVPKLFLPESEGGAARLKQAVSLRGKLAVAEPDITEWQRSIATAMRPQLARAEGEVGNLAAQEQLNAVELIPDPMGGTSSYFPFFKLPDTKETATQRLKLATEFLELASKAPKGERETSTVQAKIRDIKQRLDVLEEQKAKAVNKGHSAITGLTPDEYEYAKNLASQGISKERIEAMIRAKRSEK